MEHFIRHLFFHADWLSTDIPLIIEITRRNDTIFVKRDEIAVIKRELKTNERGSDGGIGNLRP